MRKSELQKEACEQLVRGILHFLAANKKISARLRDARADIFFLPNAELRKLKKKYLGLESRVVDVLSFPEKKGFPDPEEKGVLLGEIFLNSSIAGENPPRARYLLVHGLLHLLGYDHIRKSDNIRMQRTEDLIINKGNFDLAKF